MDNINIGINEKIVTGRKFRRLIDKDSKLWQLISWWTKASDVEFDDGKTAEQKLGNINGITSDPDDDGEDIAASMKVISFLKQSFRDGYKKIVDALIAIGAEIDTDTDNLSPDEIAEYIVQSSKKCSIITATASIPASSGSNVKSVSFSIASLYDNYKNITINNMVIQMIDDLAVVGGTNNFYQIDVTPTYKYNKSTGVITATLNNTNNGDGVSDPITPVFVGVYNGHNGKYRFKIAIIE